MGLITKQVDVRLSGTTIQYYKQLGYDIPYSKDSRGRVRVPKNTKLSVNVSDLSSQSNTKIEVLCDGCGRKRNITWANYMNCVHDNGKYYCQKCTVKLFGGKAVSQAKLVNSISFYDWCYKNLTKNKADEIIQRWDYKLNKCDPKDICYSSGGFNRKGYWFKCLKHPEHKSELKNIRSFTTGEPAAINCIQCNSLGQYLIDTYGKNGINTYWSDKNKKNVFNIAVYSGTSVLLKCPNCGYEKRFIVSNFVKQGYSCPKCSNKISYPERLMLNVLQQLNVNFITQYSCKYAKWCKGKDYNVRYDFYIPYINCIIETHGLQHYEETTRGRSLKVEHDNDIFKEKLAKRNNVKNYIIIDCRYSDLEYIKSNIFKSKLTKLFDLSKIDWIKCDKFARTNLIKEASLLWKNGIKSKCKIAEILHVSSASAQKYLQQGAKIYNSGYYVGYEKDKFCNSKKKKVFCIELNLYFKSITEASQYTKVCYTNIERCCNNILKNYTAGGYHWLFYEDYLKQQKAS